MDIKSKKKNNDNISAKQDKKMRIVKWMWTIFVGMGLVGTFVLLLIYNGVIGYMPPIEELKNPHDKFASIVYASDGTTELGRYYMGMGNRVYADYDDISTHVIDALIATEDVRFNDHSGIDFKALGRAVFKTVLMGDKSSGGGSTITQQLAKQLYSKPSRNIFDRAVQKPIEWMIAIKLERFYTKDEIIKMYLNRFDFLNNAVGIKTAAKVYFNKDAKDLNVAEAAMLVGMLKNPSYFNPVRKPERVLNRRNVVFDQMVKAGFLDEAEAERLKEQPLGLNYKHVDHRDNGSPYMREQIRHMLTAKKPSKPSRSDYKTNTAYTYAMGKYNTDSTLWHDNPLYGWVEKNPKPDGSSYNIYTDGLRIYTTIDSRMQKYLEEAVYEHLGGYLQPAFEAEKRGSKRGPYTTNRSQLSDETYENLITQAKKQSERYRIMKQAGHSEDEIETAFNTPTEMSVFAWVKDDKRKTVPGTKDVTMTPMDSILYMKSILRAGVASMDPITGYVKAYVGGPDYTYFQYDMVTLGRRQIGSTVKPFLYTLAMENEFDPCSMLLCSQPTYDSWSPRSSSGGREGQMVDLKWALTTSNNWISARLIDALKPNNLVNEMRLFGITGHIDPTYPLCLGTNDVSVMEMVAAYTAFANQGIRVDPIMVTRIEDSQGNVITDFSPRRTEVISENAYYKMIYMLQSVINNGTGASLRSRYGISAEMGGKTGTTNANSDSWFMGFTPELVTGVWVGGEERYIQFNSMAYGQGARAALPIYGLYMKKVYDDPKLPYSQSTRFDFPADFNPCDLSVQEDYGEEAYIESVPGIFE